MLLQTVVPSLVLQTVREFLLLIPLDCLLDREAAKLLKQVKARRFLKNYENQYIWPRIEPLEMNGILKSPIKEDAELEKNIDENNLEKVPISKDQVLTDKEVNEVIVKPCDTSAATKNVERKSGLLKIGSLSINLKKAGCETAAANPGAIGSVLSPSSTSATVTAKQVNFVTVGSMLVTLKSE
ncbi:uncharacterized protein LOC108192688 isoform X1 [Daucus carota subsp. sativus]|uniref:uncharacterized protein LOC108192688 isoform X1 n=1 Tax=Daucus carota subsp. sativus TaxID=79200 RepID=UPI00308325D0